MAVDPATLGLSAAVSLFSSRSARRKASRQRRQANVIRDLSAPGEPQDLPRIYGRYGAEGIYVDARGPKGDYQAGNALRQGGSSDRRRVFRGWLGDGYFNRANSGIQFDAGMTVTDPDGAGTETEFVLALWAFADGEGHRPYWLQVDGASHDAFYLNYGQRFEVDMKGGRANALATANGFPSTHIFTDCPYALGAMRLAFPAQYTDIPRLKLFGEWRLVRTVDASNALSTTRTYSNNRVWCLLDYLLDADIGGLFGATDIDLASFRAAALVADTFVDTLPDGTGLAFDRHGAVWRRPGESWPDGGWRDDARHEVPEWWLDFTNIQSGRVRFAPRSGGGHSDAPNGPRNQAGVTIRTAGRFHAGGKEWKFDWSNVTGTQGEPAETFSIAVNQIRDAETNAVITSSDYSGWSRASVSSCWPEIRSSSTADSKYRLRLYEMNGPLDSEGSVRENIDGFMQGFDNAALYLVGTTLHVSVINATTQAQADALVLHELDDDDFIEPPEVAMRDRAETATRVRGRFHDAAMDGAEREVLWPPAGDAAYATGLAENGGVASERSVFLVGVDNIVHAEASVRSIHQQSNGATDIQLHLPLAYHTLRPNNVVAVTIQGTRVVCLVEELEIDDDAEAESPRPRVVATLSTFDWTDTAWNTSQAMADPVPGGVDGGRALPEPTAATATLDGRTVTVSWTFDRRLEGGFIEIRRRRAGHPFEGLAVVSSDAASHPDAVGDDAATYDYEVRYRNSAGRRGAALITNTVTVRDATDLSSAPTVDDEGCFNFDDIGGTANDGGYHFYLPQAFKVATADDLRVVFKRYAAADELVEPEDSAARPSDVYTDVSNVPSGPGTVHWMIEWRDPDANVYRYGSGDDIRPRPYTVPQSGQQFLVIVAYLGLLTMPAPPVGGVVNRATGVADTHPNGNWRIARFAQRASVFPPGVGTKWATIIVVGQGAPQPTTGTWTQDEQDQKWYRHGTREYDDVFNAPVIGARLSPRQTDGTTWLTDEVFGDITARGSPTIFRQLPNAALDPPRPERWVGWRVIAAYGYGDPRRGVDLLLQREGKIDGGYREDLPRTPDPVQWCFRYSEYARAHALALGNDLSNALENDAVKETVSEALATVVQERVYWQGAAAGQTASQTPREQTLTAPAPTRSDANALRWSGVSFGAAVLPAFLDGGGTGYLRDLSFFGLSAGTASVWFRFATGDSGDGASAGPQMTDQWEGNWELEVSFGGQSWTVDHTMFTADVTEPYTFGSGSATAKARLAAARAAIGNSAGATIAMRDGATVTTFTATPAATPPLLDDDWPIGMPAAPWRTTHPGEAVGMNVWAGDRMNIGGVAGVWEGPTLLTGRPRIVNLAQGQMPDPADLVEGVLVFIDEP